MKFIRQCVISLPSRSSHAGKSLRIPSVAKPVTEVVAAIEKFFARPYVLEGIDAPPMFFAEVMAAYRL